MRLADCTMLPVQKICWPDIEIDAGKVPVFRLFMASTMRPAQPVPLLEPAVAVCICTIWSECENRLVGRLTADPKYCGRLVGCTMLPTFATTANFCCAHSGWTKDSPSFTAYGVPSLAVIGSNLALPSGSASEPRAAVYWASGPADCGTTMLWPSLPPERKMQTSAL